MKKNSIRFTIEHPNVGPAQAFLNSIEEELLPVEIDLTNWKHTEYIEAAYGFKSVLSQTLIVVIFCRGYHEGNKLGIANCQPVTDQYRWTQNGSAIYVVSGSDSSVVSELVGLFAGRE